MRSRAELCAYGVREMKMLSNLNTAAFGVTVIGSAILIFKWPDFPEVWANPTLVVLYAATWLFLWTAVSTALAVLSLISVTARSMTTQEAMLYMEPFGTPGVTAFLLALAIGIVRPEHASGPLFWMVIGIMGVGGLVLFVAGMAIQERLEKPSPEVGSEPAGSSAPDH